MLRWVWPALNPFSIHVTLSRLSQGRTREAKMCKKCDKMANFWTDPRSVGDSRPSCYCYLLVTFCVSALHDWLIDWCSVDSCPTRMSDICSVDSSPTEGNYHSGAEKQTFTDRQYLSGCSVVRLLSRLQFRIVCNPISSQQTIIPAMMIEG